MHRALPTEGKTPRIAGKPGEFEGEFPFEAATRGLGETTDLEKNTGRIEQGVQVLAVRLDAVLRPRHGLAAGPAAEHPAVRLVPFHLFLAIQEETLAGHFINTKQDWAWHGEHA